MIVTHGWPSSVLDFHKVIGPLTDPAAHGGDPRDAFHLVVPSLPGFGFSDRPTAPGWGFRRIADALQVTLMDRLGYQRWGAQGGDLGCAVTDEIGRAAPDGCVGLHLNFAMFPPTPRGDQGRHRAGTGHARQRRLVLGEPFGLRQTTGNPSADHRLLPREIPIGLAAWIYAMYQDTCGTPGDAEASFTLDELLDTIMLYWLPNTGASFARMYWEMARAPRLRADPRRTHHRAHRIQHVPRGTRAKVQALDRAPLQQRDPLQRTRRRRPLRSPGAAERFTDDVRATFRSVR